MIILRKILLIYHTLKFLKFKQLYWQIRYRLKKPTFIKQDKNNISRADNLVFSYNYVQCSKYLGNNSFRFLNLDKKFNDDIDWNFLEFGKLWNYNLEYFDFLSQIDISIDEKTRLISDFYSFSIKTKRKLEPYPVSLRTINIIRFVCGNNINKNYIDDYIYQELTFLNNNCEYHILGNHLLENAFSLLIGGAYFNKLEWYNKAKSILHTQLEEQILIDGAHFELSPMYHKIILYRILELIDWYSNYTNKDIEFLEFCRGKASIMLGWLYNISFSNGDIPLFKDSAFGITLNNDDLYLYADRIGIIPQKNALSDSGYRSYNVDSIEVRMSFAQIGASYQPGHAHADALSFLVYYKGSPLFVEQGTSTYQIGERRNLERSTEAHNTVVYKETNQSEVWGGFRVARRAKTHLLKDSASFYSGYHDGYNRIGTTHFRSFYFEEKSIEIKDKLSNNKEGVAYLHIAPGIVVKRLNESEIRIPHICEIIFKDILDLQVESYEYANSYNIYSRADRIVIKFRNEMSTSIKFLP